MFKSKKIEAIPLTPWQLIFVLSKSNGGKYLGNELPSRKWEWPKHTYLQSRLPKTIAQQGGEEQD